MNKEELATFAEKNLERSTGGLRDFRMTHLEIFKKLGFANKDPEAYKYTNIDKFMSSLENTPHEGEDLDVTKFHHSDFHTFIFIDGELSGPKTAIPGLTMRSVADSFASVVKELKLENPLSSLHHSLLSQGIVFNIEAKTKIEKPIRILNVITRSGLVAPTVFIHAESFSEASFLEERYDQDISHAYIGECFVHVDKGAKLEHIQLSQGSPTSLLHTVTNAQVARDGSYRNILLNLSGKLNRRNLKLELHESGAHGESYNLYLTNLTEHSDINTVIHHLAADTTSNQIAKGILDGESKAIFTGKIHIHPQAQRVASGQINKNLLLSQKAQVHSQPQLEIFADDVKCSHGSTTGQLSDDEIFYFQARGIPADKAKTLLAHGFGLEVVLKVQNKTLRKKVEEMVLAALKSKFHLGTAK